MENFDSKFYEMLFSRRENNSQMVSPITNNKAINRNENISPYRPNPHSMYAYQNVSPAQRNNSRVGGVNQNTSPAQNSNNMNGNSYVSPAQNSNNMNGNSYVSPAQNSNNTNVAGMYNNILSEANGYNKVAGANKKVKGLFQPKTAFPADTPVGMAYVPYQMWETPYDDVVGFVRGTIFPSLDKPFIGEEAVSNAKQR